eukprot:758695-Rhodomonas_salina.1
MVSPGRMAASYMAAIAAVTLLAIAGIVIDKSNVIAPPSLSFVLLCILTSSSFWFYVYSVRGNGDCSGCSESRTRVLLFLSDDTIPMNAAGCDGSKARCFGAAANAEAVSNRRPGVPEHEQRQR